jgi:hypothetical protein
MTNLKEIKKEFDEKFKDDAQGGDYWDWELFQKEVWSFIEESIKQSIKEEDKRIMDLSYEAMSGNDWTDKNHSKVCSFLITHTDLKGGKNE